MRAEHEHTNKGHRVEPSENLQQPGLTNICRKHCPLWQDLSHAVTSCAQYFQVLLFKVYKRSETEPEESS